MQLLFLFLFGGVVCFILYLSYDKHVSDKKKDDGKDELEIDLNKYSEVIETKNDSSEKILEKVVEKKDEIVEEEVVKFRARRVKREKENSDEEII